jgi:lysophospholipase L1-like esterase
MARPPGCLIAYPLLPMVGRLLLATAATALSLLLAEGVTRLLASRLFDMDSPTHRFDPQLGHVQKSGLTMVRSNEADERVRVVGGALGIREPPAPYRRGAPTVLVAGDSFAAGTQLRFEDTWPWHLQQALRAGGADVQVVNAGVDGYDLGQTYLLTLRVWDAFPPRLLVLSLYAGNDILDYDRAAARPPWRRAGPGDWLRERSYFLHLLGAARRRWRGEKAPAPGHPLADWSPRSVPGFDRLPPPQQRSLRRHFAAEEMMPVLRGGEESARRLASTERMLSAFAALARERGAGLAVVLIPTKQQAVPEQRAEWMALHGLTLEQALAPQRGLGAWARREGVLLVDTTEALARAPRPASLFWTVNMHLAHEGHRVVAAAAAEPLRAAVLGP